MAKYEYEDSEYKKRLRTEAEKKRMTIEEQAEMAAASREKFLDESLPEDQRLAAARQMGHFTSEEEVNKAIALFRNNKQPESLRALALSAVAPKVTSDETLIKEVIGILKNREGEGTFALCAMSVLQLIENSIPSAIEKHSGAYRDALRSAAVHRNKNLRTSALEVLAMERDEYAQRVLMESLEKGLADVIEPEVAIQLLAYDLHSNYYPVLRKIAQDPPNPVAKREALRNLGADASSKDLLTATLTDTSEDPETRHAAATALMSQAPELTEEKAKKIIIDEKGERIDELKAALLNTLAYTKSSPPAITKIFRLLNIFKRTDEFPAQLKQLKEITPSPALQRMIDLYLGSR